MLRRLRYLLFMLLISRCAAAQTYEPGLLIRSNGDTLRGEIENGFWVEPPTFIHFRRGAGSEAELFRPAQLRAVSFTGGRYFRYQALALDHAATTQVGELPRGNAPRLEVDSLLAEVLLAGPVSLLRVVRPGSTHYVLQRPDRPALELAERQYLWERPGGGWQIMDGNNYHDQLKLYFRDCPAAAQAAKNAAFTAEGLALVAQAYATSCTTARQPAQSWLAQSRPRRRGAFRGGVLAGMRYNRIESPSSALVGTCTDCLVRPFAGLYAELFQPSRVTAFYGELSLSKFRNQGVQDFGYQNNVLVYRAFEYGGWLGTARLGVRYFRPLAHSQQLLFGLGFEYNRAFGLTLPVKDATASYLVPGNGDDAYATPTLLPNLSVGWRQQRLTLLLDGQAYTSQGDRHDFLRFFVDRNFALRLGASYRLGRNPDDSQTPLGQGK
jgi:hypothetical protein